MRYPLIIVPGDIIPKTGSGADVTQEVPCPHCLKPMMLSPSKLKIIFLHYFIEDNNQELDVMCIKCIENEVFENEDTPYSHKRLKILSVK